MRFWGRGRAAPHPPSSTACGNLLSRPVRLALLLSAASPPALCFSSAPSSPFSSSLGALTFARRPPFAPPNTFARPAASGHPIFSLHHRTGHNSAIRPHLPRGGASYSSSTPSSELRATSASAASGTAAIEPPQRQQPRSSSEPSSPTPPDADTAMSPVERLAALRQRMAELDLDVYLVPSDDPHLSEYVPAAYMRRAFLSGFQGSAGTAVVTAEEGEKARLWTDSRYWNEAGLQLDASCWELQRAGLPETPTIPKWLADRAVKHCKEHSKPLRVGLDPFVHAASFAKEVLDAFQESASQEEWPSASDEPSTPPEVGVLVTEYPNLVDPIWGEHRPAVPTSPFRVHPLEYAGVSVPEKVAKVRKEMLDKKATLAVFSTLDDVAYLLNVRSKGDVDTCPVGIAYASVTSDDVRLYCDLRKVEGDEIRKHLEDAGVTLHPYDAVVDDLQAHLAEQPAAGAPPRKVWMDKGRTNYGLISLVPEKALVDAKTAVTDMKAAKNEAELQGMRRAHVVDGAAMAHFMAWLEHAIVVEGRKVSEVEIDEVLTGYRAQQPGFVEVSFPTIAGVGPNGAIIHYRASADSDILRYMDATQPILIDSGGQYLYGTTDVTRSWHFGTPSPEYVDAYTRVLKGHIGLDELIFPENTPGFALDIYARRWLWDAQKDYGHGTGHGVGAALNVHEGPMSISPRWNNKEGLKAGMVVSNEPGYYEDGNFGIRIENLIEIQYVDPADAEEENKEPNGSTGDNGAKKAGATKKKFLHFKKLTMIPIQKNLIDVGLMTTRELDWLDAYHEEVFAKVSPLLETDSPAMAWLVKSCAKIERP